MSKTPGRIRIGDKAKVYVYRREDQLLFDFNGFAIVIRRGSRPGFCLCHMYLENAYYTCDPTEKTSFDVFFDQNFRRRRFIKKSLPEVTREVLWHTALDASSEIAKGSQTKAEPHTSRIVTILTDLFPDLMEKIGIRAEK